MSFRVAASTLSEAAQPFLPRRRRSQSSSYASSVMKPLSRTRILILSTSVTLMVWGLLLLPLPRNHSAFINRVYESDNAPAPQQLDGGSHWTLSPPRKPLSPAAMARTCAAVAAHHLASSPHGHASYYHHDGTFVDPGDAPAHRRKGTCDSSLTYVLSGAHGLAESLLELFTASSLAAAEGRAFFVDDRNWAWGPWTAYFSPAALAALGPACKPPRPQQMVPCPRTARHLVASHETRAWMFGHMFAEEFEDARAMGVKRQERIFGLVRDGCARMAVVPDVREDVERRKLEIAPGPSGVVGVHVRHGEVRPRTWKWRKGVIPLDVYAAAAKKLARKPAGEDDGTVVFASDDAAVYADAEFSGFEPVFPALAMAEELAAEQAKREVVPGYTAEKLLQLTVPERITAGRRYLQELLVMGETAAAGGPDDGGIVCGGTSATCRLLAVMMGWEKAISNKRWVDVDGEYEWRGIVW